MTNLRFAVARKISSIGFLSVAVTRLISALAVALTAIWLPSPATAADDPLDSWQQRNPLPAQFPAHSAAYGNGRWVSVGWYGLILTSTDGAVWTQQFLPGRQFKNLGVVSFAKDRFFISADSTYYDSLDGITWTPHVLPASGQGGASYVNCITHLNGLFLALCSNELLYTSTDGLAWTPRHQSSDPFGSSPALLEAKFGNGVFVALADSEYQLISSDGENWQRLDLVGIGELRRLAFGNGIFVAVGRGGARGGGNDFRRIYSSTDGLTWDDQGLVSHKVADIVFANGEFLAVLDADTHAPALVSQNGAAWTQRGAANAVIPLSLGVSDAGLVLLGQALAIPGQGLTAAILTSPNGESWTRRDSGLRGYLDDIVFGGGQFVAVGGLFTTNANVFTSPDGITWTRQSIGTTNNLRRIAYGAGKYVVIGRDGTSSAPYRSPIFTSPDAVTWTKHNTAGAIPTLLNSIVYAEGAFVAVGFTNTVARSIDGAAWTSLTLSETTDHLWAITHGNEQFVAVGEARGSANPAPDNILTSSDAVTWTRRSTGEAADLRVVAFGNGKFVTVDRGISDQIVSFTSSDGAAWTKHTESLTLPVQGIGNPEKLIFARGRFMLALRTSTGASYAMVLSSVDGATWKQHITGAPLIVLSLAYGRNTVVLAADLGNLLQSGVFPTADAFLTGRLVPGQGFQINLAGGDPDFELQRTGSLLSPEWETLGRFDSAGNFLDPVPQSSDPKFYRAVSPP